MTFVPLLCVTVYLRVYVLPSRNSCCSGDSCDIHDVSIMHCNQGVCGVAMHHTLHHAHVV